MNTVLNGRFTPTNNGAFDYLEKFRRNSEDQVSPKIHFCSNLDAESLFPRIVSNETLSLRGAESFLHEI